MTEALPPVGPDTAFFFDFDGTLVDIAPRPELVHVEPQVRAILEGLWARFDGAVAVITGRPLDVVEGFLEPLVLPIAGEHGSIWRDAAGELHANETDVEAVDAAERMLAPLVEANEGLILERKRVSVALHYRQRPELADMCAAEVATVVANEPALVILPGKMVFELKPEGVDKGVAVRRFLDDPPFKDRVPVFMGDDITDEHAFEVVNALGGVTIKIDDGDTTARYRTDRQGLFDWLGKLADDR
jgi:trehalose 6-phosphate phosphatase